VDREGVIALGAPSDDMDQLFGDCHSFFAVHFDNPNKAQEGEEEQEVACKIW